MSERTRTRARQAATDLEAAIGRAVRADYPSLCGWALRVPHHRIVRYGPREDDWRWGAYPTAAEHAAAYRRYCERAVQVAASRISECYGLGVGSEWAERHFGAEGDERAALAGHIGAAAYGPAGKALLE